MGHQLPVIDFYLEESIDHANRCFVIAQLGCCHGRLLKKTVELIRKKKNSLDYILVGVEASPLGYKNLIQVMEECSLHSSPHKFHNLAISDQEEGTVALIEMGVSSHITTKITENVHVETVCATTISKIIKDYDYIDFLEMDIQGAEYKAIPASIDAISQKVKMICIRTHREKTSEKNIENLFKQQGWQRAVVLYNRTPVLFQNRLNALDDGIHYYVNTRLREPININVGDILLNWWSLFFFNY